MQRCASYRLPDTTRRHAIPCRLHVRQVRPGYKSLMPVRVVKVCLKTIAKSASTSAKRVTPWHPEFGSETTACARATGTASGIGDCPGAGPSPRLEEKMLPRRPRLLARPCAPDFSLVLGLQAQGTVPGFTVLGTESQSDGRENSFLLWGQSRIYGLQNAARNSWDIP
jgi:hypothetical protein